jgi:hypothetical protein
MTLVRRDVIAGVLGGLLLLASAQAVRRAVAAQRDTWPKVVELPYAPSPGAAPFVTLGYRELATDLLWVRGIGYFGGEDDTAEGIRGLVDAMIALDPMYVRSFEWGARAVEWADGGATQADRLWAVAILERGMGLHPTRWKLPYLAGQIYVLDLETEDPAQRSAWQARGAELIDRAVRMPGAMRGGATLAAHIRSQLGQQERAERDLEEMIATTSDPEARIKLINKLAALRNENAQVLAEEFDFYRRRFLAARLRALPEADDSMYILVGEPPKPYIDLGDLAVGGDQPTGLDEEVVFEPVPD